MTQEEILEYNKMCAEILGYKNKGMKNLEMWVSNKTPNGVNTNELQFHSDWNWIMEVVEAIEKIEVQETIKEIPNMELERRLGRLLDLPIYTKKEAVVKAINQFLIYHNENK